MEKQCKKCGETKPIEQFSTNGIYKGKVYYIGECKICYNARKRTNNSIKLNIPISSARPLGSEAIKEDMVLDRKKDGCSVCGYNEYMFCIDLHHIDSSTKHPALKVRSASIRKLSIPDLAEELKLVIPLCAMCHRKVHAGIIKL